MPEQTVTAPPAVKVDAELTALITRTIIMIKRKEPAAEPVYFRVDSFTDDGSNEITPLELPGDDGVIVPVRRDQTKREEKYVAKTNEIGKWVALTGGQNIVFDATVRIWKFDPKDPANKCRMASEEFEASVERDGNVPSGEKKHDLLSIKMTSLKQGSAIQWYWKPTLTQPEP